MKTNINIPIFTQNILYSLSFSYYFTSIRDALSLEFEWQQASSCILVVLNQDEVWIVSARPPISNSFSSLTSPFGIVPSAPITIGITVTFMFHVFFFSSLTRFKYLSFFPLFLLFLLCGLPRRQNSLYQNFFLTISRSSLQTRIKWSVCYLKYRQFYTFISLGWILFCLLLFYSFKWFSQ